jgi:HSP20 family protein
MPELKEAPKPKTQNGAGQTKDILARESSAPLMSTASPFAFMRRFASEMDRLFEDFGLGTRMHIPRFVSRGHEMLRREAGLVPAEWSPRVNVLQREGQFVVRADLPGLSKDDVKVEVSDDLITIQGERKYDKKEEREGYCYSECSYGSFYRAIPLPEGAEASKATAEFRNGVLEVAVPTAPRPEAKTRRLEVRETK